MKSNRQRRRELAAKRIPEFVSELQQKLDLGMRLTPRDVELLYQEHRQREGTPRSMPSDTKVLGTVWVTGHETWSNTQLLLALRSDQLDREEIVLLCSQLWLRFGDRSSAEVSMLKNREPALT